MRVGAECARSAWLVVSVSLVLVRVPVAVLRHGVQVVQLVLAGDVGARAVVFVMIGWLV